MALKEQEGLLTLTREDLQAILQTAIAEAKKPDPLTAKKLQREAELEEKRYKQRLAVIAKEGESKLQRQKNCPHRKDNGQSHDTAIVRGQLHSDGKYHPLCLECGSQFEPISPSMLELSGSVA